MPLKLEESLATGPHKQLLELVGRWSGTAATWFEGDAPVDESPVEGEVVALFDGRFVSFSYRGSFMDKPLEGVMTLAYFLKKRRFESTWMDTFHTGTSIMHSEGSADGEFFSVTGQYEGEGEMWGWRTEIRMPSPDELVIEATNISPQGAESRATRAVLARKG